MGPVQSTSSVLFFGMDIKGDWAWVDMIADAKSCRPDYGLCRGGTSRMRPVRSRSEQVVEVECDAASKRASIVRARLSLAPSHAVVLAYALFGLFMRNCPLGIVFTVHDSF
jgi:hypothetical protein